jgi:hypothetical protein
MMEYWKNGMMISKSVKKSNILSPLNPLFHYPNIPNVGRSRANLE